MRQGILQQMVCFQTEGKQNLIYKHAISTVSPSRSVELDEWEES